LKFFKNFLFFQHHNNEVDDLIDLTTEFVVEEELPVTEWGEFQTGVECHSSNQKHQYNASNDHRFISIYFCVEMSVSNLTWKPKIFG